jgi:hypothetical protein
LSRTALSLTTPPLGRGGDRRLQDRGWLEAHPANRLWFRRHPRVDPRTWREGVSLERDTGARGALTWSIEQNPLEALRLGSLVGSCLGVGGLCDYSAAAAVLDANKRVVYARDAKGAVVARQLLAISRDGRLVCFGVYPQPAPEPIAAGFRKYDARLARALRLPLAREGEPYEIEPVLAAAFWDDGLWASEGPTHGSKRPRGGRLPRAER